MARSKDLEKSRRLAESLRRAIRRHDRLYYELDRPAISDAAYDALVQRLKDIERTSPELVTPDSPTQRVSGTPTGGFTPVRHLRPMLSLDSVTDPDDVSAFDDRLRSASRHAPPVLVAEPKFDGLSVELVYRRGEFVRASTRGDGDVGEDVTANVRTIPAVPKELSSRGRAPAILAVRGEVLMRKKDFARLNDRLARAHQPTFANPRNAAAGSLRQLDARVTARRRLDIVCYDILHVQGGGRPPADGMGVLAQLAAWGFPASPFAERCPALAQVFAYHRRLAKRRDRLPYEIDGIVIKANDLGIRRALGSTGRHPRWALAFKFAPRAETTTIRDIVVQVGRTGVLTPVAHLDPIAIGGVTVSRATLHNREEIARKDLRIGDAVRVVRAGDVIPEVVGRVASRRGPRGRPFTMPRRCPACGAVVARAGPFDRCTNGLGCPAQLRRTIGHFGSRAALDIRGLGSRTIDQLVDAGHLTSVADLFALRAEDVADLEGFADTAARNLIEAIARARHTTLARFLVALGIPGVGVSTARDLADAFGTLDRLRRATVARLREIPGVGPVAAREIHAFFVRPEHRRIIDRCLRLGLTMAPTRAAGRRGPLAGETIVFTGTLDSMARGEAEARARALGARTAATVTRRTSLVVAGADPGSKYQRAETLGVRIIGEREFKALLSSR